LNTASEPGADRASHRRWLVRERDKCVALWIYAATAGTDKEEEQKYFALAIGFDSTTKAFDLLYPVSREDAAVRAKIWKRIAHPAQDLKAEDWSASNQFPGSSKAFDTRLIVAVMCIVVFALVFIH
jgi:hypothetical protein